MFTQNATFFFLRCHKNTFTVKITIVLPVMDAHFFLCLFMKFGLIGFFFSLVLVGHKAFPSSPVQTETR